MARRYCIWPRALGSSPEVLPFVFLSAFTSRHTEVVDKLLARRKTINASIKETSEGNTPLHLAAMNKHEKVARAICQAFPDLVVIKNDIEDKTPLFYMSQLQRRALRESYASRRENFLVKAFNTQQSLADLVIVAKSVSSSSDTTAEEWLEIPCHKVTVWARCPELRGKLVSYDFADVSRPGTPLSLSGSFDGSLRQPQKVVVSEFSFPVMEALIYYLYSDVIRISRSLVQDLREASKHFKLDRLATLCDVELGV